MTTQDTRRQEDTPSQGCFLCALDPERHACATAQLEGRIVGVQSRTIDGEETPFVTLDTGVALASLQLTRYYRSLVDELKTRGRSIHTLTLRIYHLPSAPTVSEHKGRTVYHYRANAYTLAVLEPDTLLNITDLNHAEYCPRQYLLNRLVPSPTSPAAIRGNLVHNCFKELLKEHDRGELMTNHAANGQETPLASLHRHFAVALERNSVEMALANVSSTELHADVVPHLESLATWYQNQRSTLWDMPSAYTSASEDGVDEPRSENMVRAETFLLAPEIGLKGRLDLLWQQSSRQRLLELKTGGSTGVLPKTNHRWQVYGYHALLTVRRNSRMKKALATLLYSGTPGQAQAFGIPFSVRELQRVNEKRNILVISHVTGVPAPPPGPSRCTKCAMLNQCQQASALLGWQAPEPDPLPETEAMDTPAPKVAVIHSHDDRAFFANYYRLLQMEGREGEQQQALLWKTPVAEHIARGMAITNLRPLEGPQPTGQGEWRQTFGCVNTSELRVGDEVLLSDGNPITGDIVTGTIVAISAEQVTVWTPELISNPSLIERYGTDVVHVRTLQNLMRWLQADGHLRALVAGQARPRFNALATQPRADFNAGQNLAIERALQMQDYLLIHGPPGTGKTSVIAEIVKRLTAQGQRVMLAAFTNQAVDNMLKRLDAEGFHDYIRLGHDRSVDEAVQKRLLKYLVAPANGQHDANNGGTAVHAGPTVRQVLRKVSVVASTTATWSSEKYAPSAVEDGSVDPLFQFDVALIDEAGQLTIPAILGALRFARRFILVGDEKQLPPLVLSKAASGEGLGESLFSMLKRLDDEYRTEQPEAISASVPLRTQYRMHEKIAGFASQYFYAGELQAHPSVARRILELVVPPGAGSDPLPVMKALRPGHPLVFLNVVAAPGAPSAAEQKMSNAEARAVRAIVAALLKYGIAQQDIGIIAPYRAQVANLRRHLFSNHAASGWQALASDSPMSIDTVDRFQGGERKVIIMSFATTTTPDAESPLRDFLTDAHRLNVALTRAQRKLILVGCVPALQELPIFHNLIAYCQKLDTVFAYH